jgi:hypothetical protein
MEYMEFCGEENGNCAAYAKNSVSVFVDCIYEVWVIGW